MGALTQHDMEGLLDYLEEHMGYDFRGYAPSSLHRRIAHAYQMLKCASGTEIISLLDHRPELRRKIVDLLTVQVSSFFRDPIYYQALHHIALPYLQTYPSIKVWVAGCSTGEEFYSLAILFAECGLLERTIFYATDLSNSALEQAKLGAYSAEVAKDIQQDYVLAGGGGKISDYIHLRGDKMIFDPRLKKNAVFFDHNLAADSVFSEAHLISCRNVLIYFNRTLQNRVIDIFNEALVLNGFLGFGTRESMDTRRHAKSFGEVLPGAHLYRKLM